MNEGKNNYTWCWQCDNWKELLGHSEINCPNVVCKNCGLIGHIRPDCPNPCSITQFLPSIRNIIPNLPIEFIQNFNPVIQTVPTKLEIQSESEIEIYTMVSTCD